MDRSLRSRLLERGRELGALAIRFTSAAEDAEARERLRRSFERGDLSTWAYDAQYAADASAPQRLLANARSVICVAVPYATTFTSRAPLSGRVSNYAWSADYHSRMRALLRELAAIIDAQAGAGATAVVCDTGPIAERAFAARAGLGWVGKHTNLINPELGSFVFLGEIVTTVEFAPDEPLRKTCGSCTRCIDRCPTGALRGDYTIDANKCIADLTQRTDSIPRELRALVGDWVWGCDICQLVCPPTMRAPAVAAAVNAPMEEAVAAPPLQELLHLRSARYKRLYRKSSIGWRGAAVLRRNAAVALGNALDRAAVPSLIDALHGDPHPMVREHAAWALGRIASPAALEALRIHEKGESHHTVLHEIAQSLRELEPLTSPSR